MTLRIYFADEQSVFPVDASLEALVRQAVEATLAYEGITQPAEVSVTFTDNKKIREINREYRQIDRATDVLSFPLFEECDGVKMLGDIVLSLEKCNEQGETFGHGFGRECAFLVAHSTLHLLGYDHETSEKDDQDMRDRQTAIVTSMGFGVKEDV